MADDNKNPAGDTECTSILPQSDAQAVEQTEVLPTHVSQAETAQMPPVTDQENANVFAGTPLESVAQSSEHEKAGDEAVTPEAEPSEPTPKEASWGKRAAIAGAAAVILSVGFGAGIITHAAVMGDGQGYYEQGYEDGANDQGNGTEDEDSGRGSDQQGPGNSQQQGPGNGHQGPGNGQQQGPGGEQGDTGSTRPGPPPQGGRGPGSKPGSQGSADTSSQSEDTTAS